MISRLISTTLVLCLASAGASAADLTVILEKVTPNNGNVRAALFNQAVDFLKKPLRSAESPANDGSVTLLFKDLPAGDYAVSAFQDVNGNKKLDTSDVGFPLEPYGISNNVRGGIDGPPAFADAAVHLGNSDLTIKVQLK
jgi:uncharacterized protein (DUF2141 family)